MKNKIYWLVLLACMTGCAKASVVLDGRINNVFEAVQYIFGDGDSALGSVRFNSGFVLPSAGTVTMNVLFPVAGPVSLGGDGILTLDGDLALASNATLSNGGIINGNSHTVFLNGNLTIGAGKTIECTSNLIIDGQGHELVVASGSPGGKIVINGASGTTLTLRNIVVRGLKEYGSSQRSIMFGAATNQKVVLENATCYLAGDMIFSGGKLDIKRNSALKGWCIFDYQAPYNLTVLADSMLLVDMHTTLKYNPSDKLRTHLAFTNKTSQLFLYGGTLDVPATIGLSLTRGNLVVDHKTVFDGNSATGETRGIMFGDGTASHDLYIDILPAAGIDVTDGYVSYNNAN